MKKKGLSPENSRRLFKIAGWSLKNTIRIVLCFSLLSIFLTCSKDDDSFNSKGKSEGIFNATFTEKTVYFDEKETNKDIISIDENRNIYSFNSSSAKAKQLKKGDIILIHGKALGKANKVTEQGNAIVVEAVEAKLNEAIEDGTIEWSTYCDFQPDMQLRAQIDDNYYSPIYKAGKNVNFEFEYGGLKYSIEMTMNKENANVKIEATKEAGAGAVKLKCAVEGKISALTSNNKIVYEKGKLKQFSNANNNLQGELTLSAIAAGSGNDFLDLKLPVVLGAYPVMVGPIPTVITLKMQFVVNAVVPLDGSAKLSTKFTYNSETGFEYKGLDKPEIKGKIGKYTIDKKDTDTGASSAIGVNFGIGFPRLEVGMFGKLVVPWIQTAFLIGGDFTSYPACRTAKASFIGGCGYDLNFLGFNNSGSMNLWNVEKEFLKVGDCK